MITDTYLTISTRCNKPTSIWRETNAVDELAVVLWVEKKLKRNQHRS